MWKIKLRSVPDSSKSEDLIPFAQPGDANLRREHGALPTPAAAVSLFAAAAASLCVPSSLSVLLLLGSNFTFLLASPVKPS